MWYCGIDVASRKSYVVVSDAKGALALSREIDTEHRAFHTALKPYAGEKLKIAIEAGGETVRIYDCLQERSSSLCLGRKKPRRNLRTYTPERLRNN